MQIECSSQSHDPAPFKYHRTEGQLLQAPFLGKLQYGVELLARASKGFTQGEGDGSRSHGNPFSMQFHLATNCACRPRFVRVQADYAMRPLKRLRGIEHF